MPDEWYVGFHQGLAARFWRAAGATMAEADLKVVLGLLPAAPAAVLDVPCGDGRLTRPLAAAGYTATGVDLSRTEIEYAREIAGDQARFEPGDLRALPDVGRFDAVVSWGNSFGYLTPAETLGSLSGFKNALKPGGRLILESLTVAESFLIGGINAHAEYEFGGVRMTADQPLPPRGEPLRERLLLRGRAGDRGAIQRRAPRPHHRRGRPAACTPPASPTVELRGPDGQAKYELGDRRMIALAS